MPSVQVGLTPTANRSTPCNPLQTEEVSTASSRLPRRRAGRSAARCRCSGPSPSAGRPSCPSIRPVSASRKSGSVHPRSPALPPGCCRIGDEDVPAPSTATPVGGAKIDVSQWANVVQRIPHPPAESLSPHCCRNQATKTFPSRPPQRLGIE